MFLNIFKSGIHASVHFNTNSDLYAIDISECWKIQFHLLILDLLVYICFFPGRYKLVFVLLHVTSDFFLAFSLQYCYACFARMLHNSNKLLCFHMNVFNVFLIVDSMRVHDFLVKINIIYIYFIYYIKRSTQILGSPSG